MVSFATRRAGIAIINRKALEMKSNGTYVPPEGSGPTTHYCLSGDRFFLPFCRRSSSGASARHRCRLCEHWSDEGKVKQ
jgi:hypothetical protein